MKKAGEDHNNQKAIRTFICIEIAKSIKERIAAVQSELRQIAAQASFVNPANIHLTLKFLGDVSQDKIPSVIEAAKRATGAFGPLQIAVGGAGCFPSLRHPSVLWIGLPQIPEALKKLQQSLEDELAGEGFAREAKLFKPHLTLARLRHLRNAGLLAEALLARGFAEESFVAREIIVMRSQLSPKGSLYTPLAVLAFKS